MYRCKKKKLDVLPNAIFKLLDLIRISLLQWITV